MKHTKEEYLKYLEIINDNWLDNSPDGVSFFDEIYNAFLALINEHFDNPPLTVADIPLEEEIMCWDNVEKEWCSIYSEGGEISIAYIMLPTKYTLYETFDIKHNNRFYRKEVVQND